MKNNFRVQRNAFQSNQHLSTLIKYTKHLHLKMAFNKEELIISIRKYPVLYDNANTEFHRKM